MIFHHPRDGDLSRNGDCLRGCNYHRYNDQWPSKGWWPSLGLSGGFFPFWEGDLKDGGHPWDCHFGMVTILEMVAV